MELEEADDELMLADLSDEVEGIDLTQILPTPEIIELQLETDKSIAKKSK